MDGDARRSVVVAKWQEKHFCCWLCLKHKVGAWNKFEEGSFLFGVGCVRLNGVLLGTCEAISGVLPFVCLWRESELTEADFWRSVLQTLGFVFLWSGLGKTSSGHGKSGHVLQTRCVSNKIGRHLFDLGGATFVALENVAQPAFVLDHRCEWFGDWFLGVCLKHMKPRNLCMLVCLKHTQELVFCQTWFGNNTCCVCGLFAI